MKIQFLVYPGMTLLDLAGPTQIWSAFPDASMQFVWRAPGPVPTDAKLSVLATTSFADAWTSPDILFVPGGTEPTFDLLADDEVLRFLASRGARAKWVTSVCTGAVLLGGAGLLRGYRATSHWSVRDALTMFGAEPSKERWVIDRNRATGAGVTAGVDFGLALLANIAGEPLARAVQLAAEYAPQPPFRSGSPDEATAETLAAVTAGWAAQADAVYERMERAARSIPERQATQREQPNG